MEEIWPWVLIYSFLSPDVNAGFNITPTHDELFMIDHGTPVVEWNMAGCGSEQECYEGAIVLRDALTIQRMFIIQTAMDDCEWTDSDWERRGCEAVRHYLRK